jgi:hypothetical protein
LTYFIREEKLAYEAELRREAEAFKRQEFQEKKANEEAANKVVSYFEFDI